MSGISSRSTTIRRYNPADDQPTTNDRQLTTLHLKSGHETRIRNGHLWAFAGEIVEPLKGMEPGEPVVLCEARGTVLGRGYVNPHSLIAVRLLTRGNETFDDGLIPRRVKSAWEYRIKAEKGKRQEENETFRLIYAESDGLPGLIVDKFSDQLVMQVLTAGMERLLDKVVAALVEVVKPDGIYFKGKSPYRKLEGLPEEDRQLYGSTPDKILFRSEGMIFTARPKEGQKTGYFLDQRGNRGILAGIITNYELRITNEMNELGIKNGGIEVLDLYSYTGGWGLTALKAGATKAVMVDSSANAIGWGMEDAGHNGFAEKALFVEADVGEFLKDAAKEQRRWDIVVVDPPALIPNRQAVSQGINAYIAINRAAMKVVKPGGLLVTCSCSHHLTRDKHLEVIGRAASQEGKRIRVAATGGHSWDHPILPGHPETEYLKCWFVEVENGNVRKAGVEFHNSPDR